jgi:cell division protein FtsB
MPSREHDRGRRRRRTDAPARRPERARRRTTSPGGDEHRRRASSRGGEEYRRGSRAKGADAGQKHHGLRDQLRRGGSGAARAARAAGGAVRGGLARRARGVANTGGAFRMSTTRRAAMLAMVICALALSLSVPLRTYFAQRAEMRDEQQHQQQLRAQVQQLEDRKAQLSDPTQVEAEVRRRLGYVRPGETPYVVQLPGDGRQPAAAQPAGRPEQVPTWYESLWKSINGGAS